MTHTPGPWERRGNLLYTEDKSLPGETAFLAECASKDDADFIVRACNSHKAMLEALKELLALADMDYIDEETKPIVDRAQEAIRLVEGKA